ncbi:MAG: SAM-dependent methyltransferase, partial [Hyphomicrobium sp.]
PAWHDVIERALPHLAPGGRLHIVDFGRMHGMPAPCRLMLRGWLTRFSVTPRHDLADAVRDLAETRGFSYRVTESPRGYWVEATIVRS